MSASANFLIAVSLVGNPGKNYQISTGFISSELILIQNKPVGLTRDNSSSRRRRSR
jgi:hypothetical protein